MNACDSVMRLQHTPSRSRAALVDDVSTRAGDHAAMGYTSAACRAACILALVAGARAAAVAEPSGSFELDEFPADYAAAGDDASTPGGGGTWRSTGLMGRQCAPSVLSTFALSSACLERDDEAVGFGCHSSPTQTQLYAFQHLFCRCHPHLGTYTHGASPNVTNLTPGGVERQPYPEEVTIDLPGVVTFTCVIEGLTPSPRGGVALHFSPRHFILHNNSRSKQSTGSTAPVCMVHVTTLTPPREWCPPTLRQGANDFAATSVTVTCGRALHVELYLTHLLLV
jgi:hypothetical protein